MGILKLALTAFVLLIITLPMAKGESATVNQEDNKVEAPQTDGNIQQKNTTETAREILDYWTPERMRNAKPLLPRVVTPSPMVPPSNHQQPSGPVVGGSASGPVSN